MKHYITDKTGTEHSIEEYGCENGMATICINNYRICTLKMYYRPERTWDDHMGNTPCGYYVVVTIKGFDNKTNRYFKERHRVYLSFR